ncbi:MAG: hypothetical protein ACKOXB_03500 [Flavobacteriales bacterium]
MENMDYFQSQIQIVKSEKQIRWLLWFFVVALFLSGLSAFPLVWGSEMLLQTLDFMNIHGQLLSFAKEVRRGVKFNDENFSFMAYGTDWLAFGHIMYALLFYGALRNPFKNKWLIHFGMIACVCIVPASFLMGHFRSIPLLWGIVDSSFGIVGFAVLYMVLKRMKNITDLRRHLRTFNRKNITQEKPAA